MLRALLIGRWPGERLLVAVMLIAVAACGGGGGDDSGGNEAPRVGYSALGVATYSGEAPLDLRMWGHADLYGDRIYATAEISYSDPDIPPSGPGNYLKVFSKSTNSVLYTISNSSYGVFGRSGNSVYLVDGGLFKIWDVSSSTAPNLLGQVALQSAKPLPQPQCIYVSGGRAFVVSSNQHTVIDVADSARPVLLWSSPVTQAFVVSQAELGFVCGALGDTLVVRQGGGEATSVGLFDISDRATIRRLSAFPAPSAKVRYSAGYLYLASGRLLEIYQVRATEIGEKVAQISTKGLIRNLWKSNGKLLLGVDYVTDDVQGNWMLYDVSTPAQPRMLDYGEVDGDSSYSSNLEASSVITDGFSIWMSKNFRTASTFTISASPGDGAPASLTGTYTGTIQSSVNGCGGSLKLTLDQGGSGLSGSVAYVNLSGSNCISGVQSNLTGTLSGSTLTLTSSQGWVLVAAVSGNSMTGTWTWPSLGDKGTWSVTSDATNTSSMAFNHVTGSEVNSYLTSAGLSGQYQHWFMTTASVTEQGFSHSKVIMS